MAEESDSAVVEEQPSQAPAEENSFGMIEDEFQPDTPAQESDPTNEQTEEAPQPTTETVDNGGQLRLEDYTRKTQDHAENVRQWDLQRAEQQRALDDQRAQLTQAMQQPQQFQQSDALSQAAQDPNLTQAERAGLNVLAETQRATEELRGQIATLQQFQEQLAPQFQQTQQDLQGLTQAQKSVQDAELRTQGQEAAKLFGEDAVRNSVNQIYALKDQVNPLTNKNYSVAEIVGMVTGKVASQAAETRESNRNTKGQFQAQAKTNGSNVAVETGSHSEADALSEIKGILSGQSA